VAALVAGWENWNGPLDLGCCVWLGSGAPALVL
jgi:hypothetical protein